MDLPLVVGGQKAPKCCKILIFGGEHSESLHDRSASAEHVLSEYVEREAWATTPSYPASSLNLAETGRTPPRPPQ